MLVGYILINIVMAILLDEFAAADGRAKAAKKEEERTVHGGPLDPLLMQARIFPHGSPWFFCIYDLFCVRIRTCLCIHGRDACPCLSQPLQAA